MTKSIEDAATDFQKKLSLFQVELANEFLRRVKQRTPVRTGVLKAGWYVQVNEATFTLVNDVDYALWVNNGTETQRGQFMFETTLAEVDEIARTAAKRVGLI